MVSKKILLIINPTSGWGQGRKLEKWFQKKALEFPNIKLDVVFSSKSGYKSIENQARRAKKQGYDCVGIVGGDGSCHEAVNGLAMSDVSLAIIPDGTSNDFSKGLGIPQEIEKSFEIAVRGKEVYIDLGMIDGRFFANVASFGFDAQLVRMVLELKKKFKSVPNKGLYTLAVLEKLTSSLKTSKIRINNGEEKTILGLVVTNGPQYGGTFKIAPKASYTDGLLDCCFIEEMNRLKLLQILFKLLNGTHSMLSEVKMNKTPFLIVSSSEYLDCEVDGEIFESKKEYVITVRPRALRVVIPQEGAVR